MRTRSVLQLCVLLVLPLILWKNYASQLPFQEGGVLILTAHPDDECMFFAPTILALVSQSYDLVALCLSTGDSEGLGSVRKSEIHASYSQLGIEAVHVLDHPLLRDDIQKEWDPLVISTVLEEFVLRHKIHTILTFDTQGISGHPNHISLPKGAASLASRNPHLKLDVMALSTVPVLAKYSGVVMPLMSRIASIVGIRPSEPRFISSLSGYFTALRAMRQHQSQLVWFRWLYVVFSRYMWMNDWARVD